MRIKRIPYIGNGAYCYANSTSMLLSCIGENISPSKIEVLTGVGLGASLKRKGGYLYFNNQTLLSDLGISNALDILGFSYEMKASESEEQFPLDKLKTDLSNMPVVLGPLDMFYLVYNPRHKYLKGADHYVLAYKIDTDKVFLHDPAGFPFVSLSIDKFRKAWKAEGVWYKKGYYRYITSVKRISTPSESMVYRKALKFFQNLYVEGEKKTSKDFWFIGKEAILQISDKLSKSSLSEDELGHFIYFALPLGAKRALDFAFFFNSRSKELAFLKRKQAQLFGEAHTRVIAKDWNLLAKVFEELAEAEEDFRVKLLSHRAKN